MHWQHSVTILSNNFCVFIFFCGAGHGLSKGRYILLLSEMSCLVTRVRCLQGCRETSIPNFPGPSLPPKLQPFSLDILYMEMVTKACFSSGILLFTQFTMPKYLNFPVSSAQCVSLHCLFSVIGGWSH